MKKILLILMCFCSLICNAQIYSIRKKVDKFDDTVYERTEKTLITETDSTITFEVKGHNPVTYYRSNVGKLGICEDILYLGSKENVVNLVENLYGYQVTYLYNSYSYEEITKKYLELGNKWDEWLENQSVIIKHRTITTQYTGTYKTDLWWIQFNDGSRIIFRN